MNDFKKRKFTFMEMIAIMVIIIILTTILLPVAFKSKEWGRSIKCKSNMKAMAEGILSYASDRGGCIPYSASGWRGASWTFGLKQLGYLPAPKKFIYTWTSGNYLLSGQYTGYPADYSSIWACPSQEIAPMNKFMSKLVCNNPEYGLNSYVTFLNGGFYWSSSHYAMTYLPTYRYNLYGRTQQLSRKFNKGAAFVGLLMDSPGGANGDLYNIHSYGAPGVTWGAGLCGAYGGANMIFGRHWGQAYGLTNSSYSSTQYTEVGSSQINTIFLDGHAESWNNRTWWNKYLTPCGGPRGTPFGGL